MTTTFADRVMEYTSVRGLQSISLGGAIKGYRTFASVYDDSDEVHYTIEDTTTGQWEVGSGTYNASANTVSRTTVYASSNSGSKVQFDSGTSKAVYVTHAAQDYNDLWSLADTIKTPEMFSAVAGGVFNNDAAILAAAASGCTINGGGRTYGVTFIDLPEGARLENMTLKQLAPSASQSVITLRALNVDNIYLKDVKIDRNGDGNNAGSNAAPNAAISTAFGAYISGGQGHHIENLEVYGNDSGSLIKFEYLDGTSRVIRPYVHDCMAIVPEPTDPAQHIDDIIQGIWIAECEGLFVDNPRAHDLTWKAASGDTAAYRHNRSIVMNGNRDLTLWHPFCQFVDQGIDNTGDLNGGNWGTLIESPVCLDCHSYGVKFANLQKRMRCVNGRAERCGYAGFTCSSSFADAPVGDQDRNEFRNCIAIDCGDDPTEVSTVAGFLKGPGTRAYKVPLWIIECVAHDTRSPTQMKWGFRNEMPNSAYGMTRLIGRCISIGHTIAATYGFGNNQLSIGTVASQGASGASETYLADSKVPLEPNALDAGSALVWDLEIEKTAAGTAAWTAYVKFGADGATTDSNIATFSFPAQTADAKTATLRIVLKFRSGGAAAACSAVATLLNDGNTVGLATRPVVVVRTGNGGFDSTIADAKFGISVVPGLNAVWTVIGTHGRIDHPFKS